MRLTILLPLSLALAACNNDGTPQNTAEAERNVTSQVASTNDTTAIDAATGEAADMAADVDFLPEDFNAIANESEPARAGPRPSTGSAPSGARTEPRPADPDADTGDE
jgi:hypothetical protein